MTDQNVSADNSNLSPEMFEAALRQPLLDGPALMNLDEAFALYAQCLHLASEHLDDATYCKALVALSEVQLHKAQYSEAIVLIKLALELMLQYLPPLHERVGALHYLLASAYQFNADYDEARSHWSLVIKCFSWLPVDAPVLSEAGFGLLYCMSKQRGMSDSEIFL